MRFSVNYLDNSGVCFKKDTIIFNGKKAFLSFLYLYHGRITKNNIWIKAKNAFNNSFKNKTNMGSAQQALTWLALNKQYGVCACRVYKFNKNPYIYKLFSIQSSQVFAVSFNISQKSTTLNRNRSIIKKALIGFNDYLFTSSMDFNNNVITLYDPISEVENEGEDLKDILLSFYKRLASDLLRFNTYTISKMERKYVVYNDNCVTFGLDECLLNNDITQSLIDPLSEHNYECEDFLIENGIFISLKEKECYEQD